MQWKIVTPQSPTNLHELEALLLANRQIEDAATFFQPPHPRQLDLSSVGIAPLMVEATLERLRHAKANQQKVIVFGDYDADGICATAILWLSLRQAGITALPFIPDRLKHGYGLSLAAIQDILTQGKPDLVITVDNGIVAHAAVEMLNQAGVDVIITDHHSPEKTLPTALAIVHTTQLCGATVAWLLSREIVRQFTQHDAWTDELLDLAGIATIADQVPLRAANRAFAFWGIKALQQTQRAGILAMCTAAKLDPNNLTTNGIHFGLAPRINAMGRLEHGMDALRLLCTQNPGRAQELAQSVSLTNIRRQHLTEDLVAEALQQAAEWQNERIIIVHSPSFHEGVIGLIAGKLMETYFKPAVVIAVGELKAKASARSIPGVNIVDLIRQVRDDLLEVGGHPMAAGFGLESHKIGKVKTRLQAVAMAQITADVLVPSLRVEAVLPVSLISLSTLAVIAKCEPFGQGNPRPIWGFKQMRVVDAKPIGSQYQHLKLLVMPTMQDPTGKPLTCLVWNYAAPQSIEVGSVVDIAGELEAKTWKQKTEIQVIVKDLILAKNEH